MGYNSIDYVNMTIDNLTEISIKSLYNYLTKWSLNNYGYSYKYFNGLTNKKKGLLKRAKMLGIRNINLEVVENRRLQYNQEVDKWTYITGQSQNEEMLNLLHTMVDAKNERYLQLPGNINYINMFLDAPISTFDTKLDVRDIYKRLKVLKEMLDHEYLDISDIPVSIVTAPYNFFQQKRYPRHISDWIIDFLEINESKLFTYQITKTLFTLSVKKIKATSYIIAYDHDLENALCDQHDLVKCIINGYPYLIDANNNLFDLCEGSGVWVHSVFDKIEEMEIGKTYKLKMVDSKTTKSLLQDMENGY